MNCASTYVESGECITDGSDRKRCVGNKENISTEWCMNNKCAQIYIDSGDCKLGDGKGPKPEPKPVKPDDKKTVIVIIEEPSGDKEFYVIKKSGSWESAQKACAAKGDKLASITSAEETKAVNKVLFAAFKDAKKQKFWTGLNDKKKERKFVWESKAAFKYANWDKKQPND